MVNATHDPRTLMLFGVPFHDVTFDEAITWCVDRMKSGRPAVLATANVDFLMQATRDPELQRILLDADLVIADGMPIVWASGRFGPKLRERVTGSDLTPRLAPACAREGLSIFLLGGAPGVAEKAAAVLVARNPGLQIAGTYSPPLASLLGMNHDDLLARLREAKPHLLLVAFGAPKQEKFMNLHARTWAVPLAMGIGGTLDFLAGTQKRAPVFVQRIGFEWLWRMLTNPKRLFKRYASNIGFLFAALRTFNRLRTQAPGTPLDTTSADPWSMLDQNNGHVLFNLGDRDWLDSEELGRLVALARRLRREGGALLVFGGTTRTRELLHASGLITYLEYRATRQEAEARKRLLTGEQRNGAIQVNGTTLDITLPAELNVATLPRWTLRVDEVWTGAIKAIRIDAGSTEFLDSSGLGWIVGARKRCQEQKIDYHATGFRGAPMQTLRLARMEKALVTG